MGAGQSDSALEDYDLPGAVEGVEDLGESLGADGALDFLGRVEEEAEVPLDEGEDNVDRRRQQRVDPAEAAGEGDHVEATGVAR